MTEYAGIISGDVRDGIMKAVGEGLRWEAVALWDERRFIVHFHRNIADGLKTQRQEINTSGII